jgi:hypothetical protein
MFLRFSLHSATADRVKDQPGDPFNRESEFYQTWQLCSLDPIDPNDMDPKSDWARQGFSVTGGPDDGVGFNDKTRRVLDDPSIAFQLNPESIAEGQTKTYRLDLHWWESDGSTNEVRAAFSDATLHVLAKAWQASAEKEKAALGALHAWIGSKAEGVVKTAMAAASVTATSWVAVGFQVLPLFELVVNALKNQSDDYITMHRFVIQTKRENGKMTWRVTPPGINVPTVHQVNTVERYIVPFADASNSNRGTAEYACLVMD